MANPEHLEILKQGVREWDLWRMEHSEIKPDLGNNTLNMAWPEYTDLRNAKLTGANLNGADFTGADLREVDLTAADLSCADLTAANLVFADLHMANLNQAKLVGANLGRAKLMVATLVGADLSEAKIWGTTFGDNDLSSVKGLETAYHGSPSTIGIDTIYKSQGKIPEVFLRGCGVPENFITFAKSLVNIPIEFYSCFISYNHEDKSFARRLHDQLQARGIRCWLDEHQMLPGDDIYE